ncbi:von Willebrand factor A domain-containing protein 2 isoform X1 [Leucoraja erinacea]|uniref:von Willebrand factor A domain-containing protein 2 isoform X1 n=1 Tax=Leucoraja erinaceus TaxID=7782 RepID=UPI0024539603|nr:von Willebrand factor A domain-containing protein 2 isoform X1 [Leucoraja erinacea]XP_055502878.1 von Willebrand factor A domain-containing protein 2 isoform X1 [Leucoraja erinacea]
MMVRAFLFHVCIFLFTQVLPFFCLQKLDIDNETIVKISTAGQLMQCSAAIDLLFMLDGSYSIGKGSFERSKHVALKLCDALDINPGRVRVGAIQYSSTLKVEFYLNSYLTKEEVKEQLKRIIFRGGSTQTAPALKYVLQKGFADTRNTSVPRILIILTDGKSQGNVTQVAAQVKETGITVFAVGVKFPRWEELNLLASEPTDSHVLFAEHFDDAVNGLYTTLTSSDICSAIPPACKLESHVCQRKSLETVKEFKGNFMCWKGSYGYGGPISTLCPYYSWKRVYKTHLARCYRTTCPDPCDSQPCQYGGSCISEDFERYHCICPAAFGEDFNCAPQPGLECSVDILLLLDGSTKTTLEGFLRHKAFVKRFLQVILSADSQINVGVAQYSYGVQVELPMGLHMNVSDVISKIDSIQFKGGSTKTGKALRYLTQVGFKTRSTVPRIQEDHPHVLILLTDSKAEDSIADSAKYAREREIFLFAVGSHSLQSDLVTITGNPQHTVTYSSPQQLFNKIPELKTVICSIENQGCLSQPLDLVFALDASSGVGKDNFDKVKDFMKTSIMQFEINPDVTQVGLVVYGSRSRTIFGLDTLDSNTNLQKAISLAPYLGGTASTGSVLLHIYDEVMSVRKGARPGVNKVVVVLTDGASTDDAAVPARTLRNNGITVFAVGIGDAQKESLLRIAGSANYMITVPSYEDLKYFEESIAHRICEVAKQPVNLCKPNPCMNGGECIVHFASYHCECNGWDGVHCEHRIRSPEPRGDVPRNHRRHRRQRKLRRLNRRGRRSRRKHRHRKYRGTSL